MVRLAVLIFLVGGATLGCATQSLAPATAIQAQGVGPVLPTPQEYHVIRVTPMMVDPAY